VSRLVQSRARELLIVLTATPLRRHRHYAITFSSYRGVIGDDLRGLYRSTYRDKHGQQRYVRTCADGKLRQSEREYSLNSTKAVSS